jgi:hypothetical protein
MISEEEMNKMSDFLQIRSNGQITLPAGLRRKANLKEGDLLEAAQSGWFRSCLLIVHWRKNTN